MTATVPLGVRSVTVVLDGSGNGQAKLGPLTAREVWHPAVVAVKTTQAPNTVVNEATCLMYVGDTPSEQNFRDGTFSGSSGDSTDRCSADVVKCGAYVWAVWTAGDPGVTARLTVQGTADV